MNVNGNRQGLPVIPFVLFAFLSFPHVLTAGEGVIADNVELFLRDAADGDGVLDVRRGDIGEIDIVLRITASEEVQGAVAFVIANLDPLLIVGSNEILALTVVDQVPGLPVPPWAYARDCGFEGSLGTYCLQLGDLDGGIDAVDGTLEVVLETLIVQGLAEAAYEVTFRVTTAVYAFDFSPYLDCNPCDTDCSALSGTLTFGIGDPLGCAAPLFVNVLPAICEGDVNDDRSVNPLDVGFVLGRFGCPVGTGDSACDAADTNTDGVVDPLDSGYVLARFGHCDNVLPIRPVERVSVNPLGSEGNGATTNPEISANGRFVAFMSEADNLVDGDTNGSKDVFVYDRQSGLIERVSLHTNGTEGNDDSYSPQLSGNGRFVAFVSEATNLDDPPSNGFCQIFVHDRETHVTEKMSVNAAGDEGQEPSTNPSISDNGCWVAFRSGSNNLVFGDGPYEDIFVRNRCTGVIYVVSVGLGGSHPNGSSWGPTLSGDGSAVAFASYATNLVEGDNNGHTDVFVYNNLTGSTSRASVHTDGTEGNGVSWAASLSADGRFVAFRSDSNNLVNDDTNAYRDVFVHDFILATTERISVGSDGSQTVDGHSDSPSISADGRFVAFSSSADNLVEGDLDWLSDIFIHDRQTGITEIVTSSATGSYANGESDEPSISADGSTIAFHSLANNLVSDDANAVDDAFVVDVAQLHP